VRADLGASLKERQMVRANALRMLLSAVRNAEIDKHGPLDEAEVVAQVRKAVKMREEAIEGAKKAGRDDVREKEEAEMSALKAYLPAALDPAELGRLVAEAVAETGASGPADMGKVMKAVMPKVAGRADGAAVSQAVRARLAGGG
jgi:hypothetical protein